MTKYICNICDYSTNRSNNLKIHNSSKKHKEKEKIVLNISKRSDKNKTYNFSCKFCGLLFTAKNNMYRHQSHTCPKRNENDTSDINQPVIDNNLLLKLYEKIEEIEVKREDERKMFMELLKHNGTTAQVNGEALKVNGEALKTQSETVKTQSETVKTSLRAINYAMKYLTNANHISPLNKTDSIKLLNYEARDSKYCAETIMCNKFEKGEVDKFLGKIVLSECIKDKNKVKQYVWACDTSRLCFIIRVKLEDPSIKDNISAEWISDKEGVKFRKFIIRPLLDEAVKMLKTYQKTGNIILNNKKNDYIANNEHEYNSSDSDIDSDNSFDSDNSSNIYKKRKYFNSKNFEDLTHHLHYCAETLIFLQTEKAEKQILEYIAPHINLNDHMIHK